MILVVIEYPPMKFAQDFFCIPQFVYIDIVLLKSLHECLGHPVALWRISWCVLRSFDGIFA